MTGHFVPDLPGEVDNALEMLQAAEELVRHLGECGLWAAVLKNPKLPAADFHEMAGLAVDARDWWSAEADRLIKMEAKRA